jgi:hypothetical protein
LKQKGLIKQHLKELANQRKLHQRDLEKLRAQHRKEMETFDVKFESLLQVTERSNNNKFQRMLRQFAVDLENLNNQHVNGKKLLRSSFFYYDWACIYDDISGVRSLSIVSLNVIVFVCSLQNVKP